MCICECMSVYVYACAWWSKRITTYKNSWNLVVFNRSRVVLAPNCSIGLGFFFDISIYQAWSTEGKGLENSIEARCEQCPFLAPTWPFNFNSLLYCCRHEMRLTLEQHSSKSAFPTLWCPPPVAASAPRPSQRWWVRRCLAHMKG